MTAEKRNWAQSVTQAMRSRNSLSFATAMWLLPMLIIEQVQYTMARTQVDSDHVASAFIRVIVIEAVLLTASVVTARTRRDGDGSALITWLVFIAAAVAGILAGWLVTSETSGVSNAQTLAQGAFFVLVAGTTIAYLVDRFAVARAEFNRLAGDRARLASLQDQQEALLADYSRQLSGLAQARVEPQLQTCQAQLRELAQQPVLQEAELQTVSAQLRAVGENVVRPLSHELFTSEQAPIKVPTAGTTRGHNDWRHEFLRDAVTTHPLQPLATVAVVAALALGIVIRLSQAALGLIAGMVLLGVALKAGAWILNSLSARRTWTRLIITVVCLAFGGYVLCIPSLRVNPDVPPDIQLRWLALMAFMVTVVGLILAVASASISRAEVDLAEQQAVVETMRWELERVHSDADALRDRLAHLVHTDVQGLLAAAALALSSWQPPTDPRRAVEQAGKLVDSAAQAVADSQREVARIERPDLAQGLRAIQESWDGFIDIQIELDPSLSALTGERADRGAELALTSIAELVANAVRHGLARTVKIALALDPELTIRAEDDGIGPRDSATAGAGLSQVSARGGSFEMERSPTGGALVVLRFPAITNTGR